MLQGMVTVVTTTEELRNATERGEAHIEIRDHLDLTSLPLDGFELLGEIPSTVQSIRVRITGTLWCVSCYIKKICSVY